jgi:hypothetical protein
MLKQSLFLIGLGMVFLFFAGCAEICPGPSLVQRDYGNSYKQAKHNQILNPDAAKDLEPVTGFDGKAAQKTIERHRKDFEKPAPPPTYVLGVGGAEK